MFLSICALAAFASVANAEPIYTYVTDATSYSAAPGSSVQVHVSLLESLSTTDTSLIDAQGGLFSAGFAVNLAPSQTNAGSLGSIRGDPSTFDGGMFSDPGNSNTEARGDDITGPTDTSGPEPTSMGLISLGYVTVYASGIAGTTTTFDLGAYNPGGGGYTLTFALPGDDLDMTDNGGVGGDSYIGAGGTSANPIAYNQAFSITAVTPEPVSCASAALAATLLSLRPRRPRQANKR